MSAVEREERRDGNDRRHRSPDVDLKIGWKIVVCLLAVGLTYAIYAIHGFVGDFRDFNQGTPGNRAVNCANYKALHPGAPIPPACKGVPVLP